MVHKWCRHNKVWMAMIQLILSSTETKKVRKSEIIRHCQKISSFQDKVDFFQYILAIPWNLIVGT